MPINDPRDIPGLLAWFSAEAEVGYSSGATLPQWNDLSGNGNHAVRDPAVTRSEIVWTATNGPSGGPAVRFPGGATNALGTAASLMLPNLFAGKAAGEIVTYQKPLVTNNAFHSFGTEGGQAHVPYTDTTAFENFGRASGRPAITVASPLTWHRYGVSAAASSWRVFENNVQRYSSTATIGWRTDPRLGISAASAFNAFVSCILLYGRALTDTERADLDAWLVANPGGGTTGPLTPAITLTGAAPTVTGSVALTASEPPPMVTLAGTTPGATGSFGASVTVPPVSGDLAGVAPTVTGSFSLEQTGVALLGLAGNAPGVFGSLGITASGPAVEVATDSVNRLNGMTLVTEWDVEVEPAVAEPTRSRGHDYTLAVSISGTTLENGRPT